MGRGWRLGLGIAAVLAGLVLLLAGAALLATIGPDGVFDLRSRAVTSGHAVVFDAISLRDLPPSEDLPITVDAWVEDADGGAVFVGVGPTSDVATYLDGVRAARVVRIDPGRAFVTEPTAGSGEPDGPPRDRPFWVASGSGNTARLEWTVTSGDWSIVLMNADGSAGVDTTGTYRVHVPILGPVAVGLTILAIALLVGGAILTVSGARMPARPGTGGRPPVRPDR